jgi:hypothetical protein
MMNISIFKSINVETAIAIKENERAFRSFQKGSLFQQTVQGFKWRD